MRSLSLACIALAACEPTATEIIVSTDTDYAIPPEAMPDINVIRFEVTLEGELPRVAERLIAGPEDLPVSLGIIAPDDVSQPVTIRATGIRRDGGDGVVVENARTARFREGASVVLPLHLLRICNREGCAPENGCDESGCVDLAAPDLPAWTGTLPRLPPCEGRCCHTCIAAGDRCGDGDERECGRGGAECVACPQGDVCTDGRCTPIAFDEVKIFDRGFGLGVTSEGRVREIDVGALTHGEVGSLPPEEHFEHAAPGRADEGTGRRFGCAVARSGRVWCWTPDDQDGDASTWAPLRARAMVLPEPAHAIATARSAACALVQASGEVYCWGENNDIVRPNDGMPHAVPSLNGASGLVGSHVAVCAYAEQAECWGSTPAVPGPVRSTDDHLPRGLGDFAELAWGANSPNPRFCGRMAGAASISCWMMSGSAEMAAPLDFPQVVRRLGVGSGHVCAITDGGALHCGRLPASEPAFEPVLVGTEEQRWGDSISSYQGATCAIDSASRLWCFDATALVPMPMPVVPEEL